MNGLSNASWAELESDPGLFTLLLRDFGIRGVAVEEVYDLHLPLNERAYGYIFLFKWLDGSRRSRRESANNNNVQATDGPPPEDVFFARQVANNSCGTYALLNVMLNVDGVCLGDCLTDLKERTKHMGYTEKGKAISSSVYLETAHNRHAQFAWSDDGAPCDRQTTGDQQQQQQQSSGRKRKRSMQGRRSAMSQMDSFHFSSFVRVGRHLFELDGLQEQPLNLGTVPGEMHWTEYFRRTIVARLFGNDAAAGREIRYNLMSIVPCPLDDGEQLLMCMQDKLELLWHVLVSNVTLPRRTRNSRTDGVAGRPKLLKYVQSFAAPASMRRCCCAGGCCIAAYSASQKEEELLSDRLFSGASVCIPGIASLIGFAQVEIERLDGSLAEARRQRRQYEVDDQRRVHNYQPFIRAFLGCMARLQFADQRQTTA